MRLRVFVVVLMFVLMVSVAGFATTLVPINDGFGTFGDPGSFAVKSGHVIIDNSGMADIELVFNYPVLDITLPQYTDTSRGVTYKPGDLLFTVAGNLFGIPIVTHSLAPNGAANPGSYPTVDKANLYSTSAFQTAGEVLSGQLGPGEYRSWFPVWLGDTPILLTTGAGGNPGALTENVSLTGDPTGKIKVTLNGQLPDAFVQAVLANGFTVSFSSTTCANGVLVGEQDPGGEVPEPASLALFGTGLFGLGMLRHRFSRAK